ncbi:MAG: N-acetylmannosamine-6-phosphate 2-epimerase [Mycoplasmatales bacterium]
MIKEKDFIVSCQALADEPLHSSMIMGRMALAAKIGGADGIRANGVSDILAIKEQVELPIIGIVKINYPNSQVYITPTIEEVSALVEVGCEVIAVDATDRLRPNNQTLDEFFHEVKKKYPNQVLMADCSTFEEMEHAQNLGFDFIGTTLFGYTDYSMMPAFEDIELFKSKTKNIKTNIIAEGQILTPALAKEVIKLENVYAIVIGGAITRPQQITKAFADQIKGN